MKYKLLSVGQNQKLGKKIAVFNLPHGITCPGMTAVCARICYAAKAERLYKAAKAKRAANFNATRDLADFALVMLAELDAFIKSGGSQCRIHESGDFYSQDYLDAWISIAAGEPEITFLAYTKSFHLDFSKAPKNMKIYVSMDSSSTLPVLAQTRPQAWIVLKGETPVWGYATCLHAEGEKHYCGTTCKTCWVGKANVYFGQH